jgi:hypothetical protein
MDMAGTQSSNVPGAVSSTRSSNPVGPAQINPVNISNRLPLDLVVYLVEADGEHSGWTVPTTTGDATPQPGKPGIGVMPGAFLAISNWQSGDIALVLTRSTGGFVCIYEFPDTTPQQQPITVSIDNTVLCAPNDIGSPPTPDPGRGIVIPPDGTRILVGCGKTATGPILREQLWQRMPNSLCLAPGETRTLSYTTSFGLESMSSEESTLTATLGLSVNAGWGPISASVNASLNRSSSSFHSLAVTSQQTTYNEETFTNPSTTSSMAVLMWQLVDVITFLDAGGHAKAVLVTGQAPPVPSAAFDPNIPATLSGQNTERAARTIKARVERSSR